MMKRLRNPVLVVGLLVVLCGVGTSIVAAPPHQIWRTYYTDSTKTVECGYMNQHCSGTTYSGCWTQWYTDEIMGRCGGNDDCVIPDNTNCRDGLDNNGDGLVDWSDPACQCEAGGME